MRATKNRLEKMVEELNQQRGYSTKKWIPHDTKAFISAIGHYHVEYSSYNRGYTLLQCYNEEGGDRVIFGDWVTASEMRDFLCKCGIREEGEQ